MKTRVPGTTERLSRALRAGALALITAGCAAVAPGSGQPAAPEPSDALAELNRAFRGAYSDAKARMLATARPLIIVKGDTAVLLHDGQREERPVNSPRYHALKAVAHIPLAIYVALTPGEGPLDETRVATLARLRELVPPARAGLPALGYPAPLLARQERIVAESLAFLDDVLARRVYGRDQLQGFTRRMAPLVLANARDAVRAQLDALHAQVTAWRRELGSTEWARLHVLIIAPHMPREGEVTTQYFGRLLHEPFEGRRIVYAESLWEEPRALDLLATHLLDGRVGEAFFDDFMRMHRDFLSDAAREYLPTLLPE
ncbi:MAG: hypothetical protein HY002_21410 [Candidatus Rokubacteria bacterium]|nr:hypothetical protein [Candidatus Rokubacteria bacterium]